MNGPAGSPRRREITLLWLTGFLCLLLLACAALDWLGATRRVDRLIHDAWVRLHRQAPPEDVVVVAVDPESLDTLGRWPWPRPVQSRLFEAIARLDPRAVVLDVLYIEPASDEADDERLAEALERLPVSILPVLIERGQGRTVEERLPVPALSRVVTDLGHIVLPIDEDGIVRRVQLEGGFGRAHWPTLGLAALEAIEPDAERREGKLPGLRLEPTTAPASWASDHEVLVPFFGPSGTFERVPAARVLRGEVPREAIEGRIVFFGLTANGLGDVVPTPLSALEQPMPGVEFHANVFAALRDGTMITRAPLWSGVLVALLVLPLTLLIYLRAPPRWGLPGALLGACVPILASFLLYRYARLWYAPLSASVPILASYLLWSRHRLDFVNRFLERERGKLEEHVPPRGRDDDGALADFFAHAARHLPIVGWRAVTRRSRLGGGARPPSLPHEDPPTTERWTERDGVYSRRYPPPAQLRIDLVIDDPTMADEITDYVDSLDRVRLRLLEPRPGGGGVERLQANAERLGEQMEWMRGVKVFSETILAGGPVGFVVWNPAGEWVRGNDLVHEMLPGLDDRAMLDDFVRAIGHDPGERGAAAELDESRRADRERVDALVLHGTPWQVAHDSGERALVVSFSAVGERLARRLICASVVDVSDIRSAERARAEMVDYLSHDLKSPLVSALALIGDESGEGGPGAPPMHGAPASVAGNIRRSLTMMDDLLHVARADSLDEADFTTLLLDDVIDNALADFLPLARARGIRFDFDGEDEELWLNGDRTLLERAIGNVVGNAVKYSPNGATVRVRLVRDGDTARVDVEDDGIGIDPAILGELFTRFRRDAHSAGRISGTGLGLALVARVVEQHEGRVEASSRPGRGTRITLWLPLEAVLDEAAERSAETVDAPPSEEALERA